MRRYSLAVSSLGFLLVAFLATATLGQEKTKPILMIDSGGHMGTIQEIFFSPDGKLLYSVSHDKTVRVWDVASGEIVRVLRGQIGAGREGKLFAGALSLDGRTLAVGGWLQHFLD